MPGRAALILTSSALLAGGAVPAAAQQPAPPTAQQRTVSATGNGLARVRPADRRDNASIRRAVRGAVAKALPRAIADAQADARALASRTGLSLGELISVAETPPTPFSFYDDTNGSFGPGRFCGRTTVSVLRRVNGERRRVLRRRRVCRFPTTITRSVTMTFAASPAQ